MKTDKIPNMVVATRQLRPVGRPAKHPPQSRRLNLVVPPDLVEAAEAVQRDRGLLSLTDALRVLLREAAEARFGARKSSRKI